MTMPRPGDENLLKQPVIDAGIRLGILVLILAWCVQIVRPFVLPVAWGAIIAVATHSAYLRIENALSGRRRLAATLYVLLAFVLLMAPSLVLARTLVSGAQTLAGKLREGTLTLPPPPDAVATWPIIGEHLHAFWGRAAENLTSALSEIAELKEIGTALLSKAAGAGFDLFLFIVAIIIAAVLLAYASGGTRLARGIATRLAGDRGAEYIEVSVTTVRSVARGVLGVALIQAILAGIGFIAVGLNAAGLWALVVFLLAVLQLPTILVLAPIVVYVFATSGTTAAIVFAIWNVVVGLSDNVLKPLLLGRGSQVPMLVVFAGVIGGFIVDGIIGLFVGPVILALGYRLFMAWLEAGRADTGEPAPGAPETLEESPAG